MFEDDETVRDRNRQLYGMAADEIREWFSTALGVRAQNYDLITAKFNPATADLGRLGVIDRGTMVKFDRVTQRICALDPVAQAVLVAVYEPHSWPEDLTKELRTPWGGGTYVGLLGRLPSSLAATRAQFGDRTAVIDRLCERIARIARIESTKRSAEASIPLKTLIGQIRNDGETLRIWALSLYEAIRRPRAAKDDSEDARADKGRKTAGRRRTRDEVQGREDAGPALPASEFEVQAKAYLVRLGVLGFAE